MFKKVKYPFTVFCHLSNLGLHRLEPILGPQTGHSQDRCSPAFVAETWISQLKSVPKISLKCITLLHVCDDSWDEISWYCASSYMSMLCKRVIRCFHEHVKLWQQTYTSCSQKVQKLLLLHTHWTNLRVEDHCWWWACSQKLKSSLDSKSLQSLPWELVRSTSKSIIFFDIHRIVHCEFVLQAVKAELHCNILKRLRENIRYTQPELWCMSIIACRKGTF